ncbi:MAG: hypothetical protein IKX25_04450 [Bacteroidales bacterium]|nr:hypothetical protein [Bacteroidales bacterium]
MKNLVTPEQSLKYKKIKQTILHATIGIIAFNVVGLLAFYPALPERLVKQVYANGSQSFETKANLWFFVFVEIFFAALCYYYSSDRRAARHNKEQQLTKLQERQNLVIQALGLIIVLFTFGYILLLVVRNLG